MSLLSLILFLLPSFNFLGWEKEYGKSIFFLFAIALFSILWPFLYLRPFPKKFFISKVDICIAAWTLYISGNIFLPTLLWLFGRLSWEDCYCYICTSAA